MRKRIAILLILCIGSSGFLFAQKKKAETAFGYDTLLINKLRWRCVGPYRAGRSLAVCGVVDQPNIYYFGATGGGVWKTLDGGVNWFPISDSTFHSSSVGAITVAPSDPNILYVGMGEAEMRNSISFGDGVYKSIDAGKTWKHIGLEKTYAISTIAVHPKNPDLVYVCAMGKVFGANPERGLYRSKDGGKTWERVLYKNDSTGCISVALDPANPRVIYAGLWQAYRNNYSLNSGGAGGGLLKSTDGGDTWKNISENPGLPVGLLGKITVAVSPVKNTRVWAMVENENGGLFMSDDEGEHWSRTTDNRELRKRPWYFSSIFADPQNVDAVYVLNVDWWKSTDGGKTFSKMSSRHGDHHDFWIDPKNNQRMILGDDGGAVVTSNGGGNWTDNDIPTCQFYHVNLDNDFPYHLYGAQQDNSSIRISSATDGYSIAKDEWYPVAGGESGYIVPDPTNSEITYGGSYDGCLTKYNKKNNQSEEISVWPERWFGTGAESKQYRFQWTFPILFSPHDAKTMYVGSQFVHRSHDGGKHWEIISPDLTRHDPKTMKPSGGPITKDNTGAEVYADVFALAESSVKKGVMWAGSDDGYIHVTIDDGKTWTNVTPPTSLLPDFALISIVEPSHYDAAVCYVAANRYKLDDTKPYLLKTTDYGKTWKNISSNIPNGDYTRVIREDPFKKGLLFSGTETGIYVSFDDGEHWQSLKQNLPVTPVHDIQVEKNQKDLVIATHGRSFWIMDDITPLHQLNDELAKKDVVLYQPRPVIRMQGGSYVSAVMSEGENSPHGAILRYCFKKKPEKEVTLKFYNANGDSIITYSSVKDKKGEPVKIAKEFYQDKKMERPGILRSDSGMNVFVWDLRYPDAEEIKSGNKAMLSGGLVGPKAAPGKYSVKLSIGDSTVVSQQFEVKRDPRIEATDDDLVKQFELLDKITKKISEVHKTINKIREVTKNINDISATIKDSAIVKNFRSATSSLLDSLKKSEEELTQPKAVTNYDLFNFPNRLDDKLAGLKDAVESADAAPTSQSYLVFDDLSKRADIQIQKMKTVLELKLADVNKMIEENKLFILKQKIE